MHASFHRVLRHALPGLLALACLPAGAATPELLWTTTGFQGPESVVFDPTTNDTDPDSDPLWVKSVQAETPNGRTYWEEGGLIRYMIEENRYFREYVVNYTNAATIVGDEFQDTEDLEGVFSGLMEYTGDPINGFIATYQNQSWQYAQTEVGEQGRAAATAQSGEQGVRSGQAGAQAAQVAPGPPFDPLIQSLRRPPPPTDPTLQHPRKRGARPLSC